MRRLCLVLCLVLSSAAGSAGAGTMTLGGFNSSRVYRPFSGVEYDNIRGLLANPANFGPAGLADHSVVLGPDTSLVTPAYLAGVSVFIMTEVTNLLAPTEVSALEGFVRGGGCLVVITDTLHTSMPYGMDGSFAGNAVLAGLGGGSIASTDTIGQGGLTGAQNATAGTFLGVPGSSTLSGPFGTLGAGVHFGGSFHNALTAGPNSRLLGTRAGSGILMEIPHGALGVGSGAVLVTGDILFADAFVPPASATLANENNATVLLNFLAACDCGCQVPEPASCVLAGLALLGAVAMARRNAR